MKRLLILTAIALLALSTTGCCRTWSSWFYRGETCDTCGSSAPMTGPIVTDSYVSPDAILPAPGN